MALVGSCSEGTAMSYNQDESFTNLLRFVDVASSHIRQALDRPRRCRRRVNHRRYLARVLSGVDVTGSTRNEQLPVHPKGNNESFSKPAMRHTERQSKRKRSEDMKRYPKVRTTQLGSGDGSKSFAAVNGQRFHHSGTGSLQELDNDIAAAEYQLLKNMHAGCGRSTVSSSSSYEPDTFMPADVSPGHPYCLTSSTRDEPHQLWFLHPAAACLPRQLQQLSPELAVGNSCYQYQIGLRQPRECRSVAGTRHIYTEDCGDYWSSRPRGSVCQQDLPSTACDIDEWLKDVSSSSWTRDHHDSDCYCTCDALSLTTHSLSSPCAYHWRTDVSNHEVTNLVSVQRQQSVTSPALNLPYSTTTASLFQTPTPGRHLNDWTAVGLREEDCSVDRSPSNFNDSGLGSTSFGSAADIDRSGSTNSPFVWPSNYEVLPSQPPAYTDSIFVQTDL